MRVCVNFFSNKLDLLKRSDNIGNAKWNYPDWWIDKLKSEYPEDWERIISVSNFHPKMTLRVNKKKTNLDKYVLALENKQIEIESAFGNTIQLKRGLSVADLPGFIDGMVSVQDYGAQLATEILLSDKSAATKNLRILDACAAPGGKTAHILEKIDAEVIAIEINETRARRINETLTRLGLKAKVICADATQTSIVGPAKPRQPA